VLDALHQNYPQIRVYSFDAGLDSSTIRALLTVYKIPATLPSLVIDGKTQSGYLDIATVEKLLPASIINPPTTTTQGAATKKNTTSIK
jgi:hypothetical protein